MLQEKRSVLSQEIANCNTTTNWFTDTKNGKKINTDNSFWFAKLMIEILKINTGDDEKLKTLAPHNWIHNENYKKEEMSMNISSLDIRREIITTITDFGINMPGETIIKQIILNVQTQSKRIAIERDMLYFQDFKIDLKALKSKEHKLIKLKNDKWFLSKTKRVPYSDKERQTKGGKTVFKWLNDFMKGWKIKTEIFLRIAAYCLLEETLHDGKAFFIIGSGGVGKSAALELIQSMFKEEAQKEWDPTKDDSRIAATEAFVGTNLVFNEDLNVSRPIKSVDTMKKVVTGNKIEYRGMNKAPITIRPHAKMIFVSNEYPKFKDNTEDYIKDRMFVIDFNGPKFRGSKYNKDLGKFPVDLQEKVYRAFFTLVVDELPNLFRYGFSDDLAKKENNLKSLTKNDIINKFVNWINEEYDYKNSHKMMTFENQTYTTVTHLFELFKDEFWRSHHGKDKRMTMSKDIFKKQFTGITGIKVNSVKPRYVNGKSSRWIQITKILKGDE